jgi:hypothetical protein
MFASFRSVAYAMSIQQNFDKCIEPRAGLRDNARVEKKWAGRVSPAPPDPGQHDGGVADDYRNARPLARPP